MGQRFNIGLFHGNKTGHLMVYCNQKIVVIDFNVLRTKTYSFFIDDEMCNLTVERKNNRWYYGLVIDHEVDTPKNALRKKLNRKNVIQAIIFLIIVILSISAITLFFSFV
ncbi:MAG: hypothetical protein KDC28_03890 [Saprospiraceae bacterium]|nr:hypothetical protein [Saprospiraceae bacterium]